MSLIDQGRLLQLIGPGPRVLVLAPRCSGKTTFCKLWLQRCVDPTGHDALYCALTQRQAVDFALQLGTCQLSVWCGAAHSGLAEREASFICLDEALFMHTKVVQAIAARQSSTIAISSMDDSIECAQNRQLFIDAGFTVLDAPLLEIILGEQ
jgi:hypothetical protein